MAYEMVMPYHLHMPSYFLETFTEYPKLGVNKNNLIISGMGGVNTLTPPAFNRRVIIEAQ